MIDRSCFPHYQIDLITIDPSETFERDLFGLKLEYKFSIISRCIVIMLRLFAPERKSAVYITLII